MPVARISLRRKKRAVTDLFEEEFAIESLKSDRLRVTILIGAIVSALVFVLIMRLNGRHLEVRLVYSIADEECVLTKAKRLYKPISYPIHRHERDCVVWWYCLERLVQVVIVVRIHAKFWDANISQPKVVGLLPLLRFPSIEWIYRQARNRHLNKLIDNDAEPRPILNLTG